jgi:hypothetical protein
MARLTQTLEPSPILQLLIRGRLGKYSEWGSSAPQGPVVLRGRKEKFSAGRRICRQFRREIRARADIRKAGEADTGFGCKSRGAPG